MSEANVERARRGFEVASRGDFEVVEQFLDPGVTWDAGDPPDPGSCHNRVQALEFMRRAIALVHYADPNEARAAARV